MFEFIKEDKSLYPWIPTILWGAIILFFTLMPYKNQITLTTGHFDKIAHFSEFAILSIVVNRGCVRSGIELNINILLLVLIFCTGYGILMELLQQFVPGRDPSFLDGVTNFIGVIFGLLTGKMLLWRR